MYSYLRTLSDGSDKQMYLAKELFKAYKDKFEPDHLDDVHGLGMMSLPEHIPTSTIAQAYLSNKYRLTLSNAAFQQLVIMTEEQLERGGLGMILILSDNLDVKTVDRVAADGNAIDKILGRTNLDSNWPAEDEGIPGHNPGQNAGNSSSVLTRLKLGPLPMEPVLFDDVIADLQDEDVKNPPVNGQTSLVSEFTSRIKIEESDDAPSRNDLQYPPSKARDVMSEVLKIKEHRDRFKIEANKDKLSVCMYTFHNTNDT